MFFPTFRFICKKTLNLSNKSSYINMPLRLTAHVGCNITYSQVETLRSQWIP